jgi:hypothetical protein
MRGASDDPERADMALLRRGPINLVSNPAVLEEHLRALILLGYRLVRIRYEDTRSFRTDISRALRWKEQFGYDGWDGNLDALNDGLRGEPFAASDLNLFCLEGFHGLVKDDARTARALLDMLCEASWDHLLHGKRLVVLIQTDDPAYETPPVGCHHGRWTARERHNKRESR